MKHLERCLRKLTLAIGAGREAGAMRTVHLALIDNSEDRAIADSVIKIGKMRFADSGVHVTYLHGHANIGYGAAHNLVLHGTGSDYHLVLNPDVELAPDALANAVRWLDAHEDVGALAPLARNGEGQREYLCKRYPSIFDLLLRGFAPAFLRRLFRRRLARYEMRDLMDGPAARSDRGPGAFGRLHAGQAPPSTRPAGSIRSSSCISRTSTGACA